MEKLEQILLNGERGQAITEGERNYLEALKTKALTDIAFELNEIKHMLHNRFGV